MRQTYRLGATLAGAVAVCGAVMFAKPSSPIPVTTTIAVASNLQLQGDGAAYLNGISGVTSIITTAPGYAHAAGDFYMDTGTQKRNPRLIYLDFSQPTPTAGNLTGGQADIFPAGRYPGFVKSNCDLNGIDLLTLPAVQANGLPTVVTCPFAIEFTANGVAYNLQMNPGPTTVNKMVLFPETNYAQLTCTGGSTVCTQFRLDPTGTYTVNGALVQTNVARLEMDEGNVVTPSMGDYYIAFHVAFGQ